ncbi:hypothetical protein HMPREF9711_03145 [Myroides odoratimimus CCUG 3837]|uniref:hypothetical protein n=1 Tax=Myroides odoratimimus TaxID=76832 RepID=UPI000280ACF0|nr:hypothetical protein [Myroides odoratimimus]EKB02360.1 hypothetical protein HMPREF9711_03145 [Myroides odoratimimus CCUG 3837]
MTTQDYIDNNKTNTLKKGDIVKMTNCLEASAHKEDKWICQTNSFKDKGGNDVVFLENYSGYFLCDYLENVVIDWSNDKEIKNIVFTEEFLNSEIDLAHVFDRLHFCIYTSEFDIYESGRILICCIVPVEHNQKILSEVIKNIDAFFLYQKAVCDMDKRYINLSVITEFMANNKLGYVKYDRDTHKLYYDHDCTDF